MSDRGIALGTGLALWSATRPGYPAVTCEGETLTWQVLHRRTNRIARGLAARGVGLGDLVTIALPNSVGFVEACWACWKLGASPQPVSSRLPKAELDAILALADPPVVIANDMPGLSRPHFSITDLHALSEDESDLPLAISPSWKAPTSGGSTGTPKLILAGQRGIVDEYGISFWRFGPDDVALMPGPLYHNGPFASAFTAMMAGCHLVLMPRFDAEGVLREVERHCATWLYLVPTMMTRIWRLPPETRARYDVSSLRTVWHLAAPCPQWLKEAWIEWLGPDVIWELYAGTESQAGTVISGGEWLSHRGSVGKVFYGQMKILDAEGNPLPPGEVGEIYLRRLEGLPESYRYIGAEARARDGWESLGDIGWFDEEGYLYLADRRSDMILVGGSNVYPAEVEAALDAHPKVLSCAVIGLPDDDLGNSIHAIIQSRSPIDVDDLKRHLNERLVGYKIPRSFEFVDTPLRDDAGKVRRSRLREERLPTAKLRPELQHGA